MKILRWIFYLALAAAVIYAAYGAYIKWFNGEPLSSLWQKATNYVSGVGNSVNTAVEQATAVQNTIASATRALSGVKTSVGTALQSLGTGIVGATSSAPAAPAVGMSPVPTSSAFLVPPPPATITTAVNAPLYFSLNSGQNYTIAWGDGMSDSGSLSAQNVTVVQHAWTSAGDYIVKVTIDSSPYTFPIRVYTQ